MASTRSSTAPRGAGPGGEAASWFSSGELAASRAYHVPLHRAALAVAGADLLVGLVVAAAAARWAGGHGGDDGWVVRSLLVGAALAGLRAPHRAAVEWWRETRHEPAHGDDAVGRGLVAATAVGSAVARVASWAVLSVALVGLSRWTPAWPLIAGGVALAGLLAGSVAGPRFAAGWLDRARPLTDGALRRRIDGLAERAGLGPVAVLAGSGRLARTGEGAYVGGFGRARRLVVDAGLLAPGTPDDVVDAVVAHELAHWRLGHLRRGLAPPVLAVVVATALASAFGRLEPAELPMLDVVLRATGLALAPLVAARSRRAEHDADALAAGLVVDGPAAATGVRQLLLDARTELEPRGVGAWLAHYPPPAARLSRLAAGPTAQLGRARA